MKKIILSLLTTGVAGLLASAVAQDTPGDNTPPPPPEEMTTTNEATATGDAATSAETTATPETTMEPKTPGEPMVIPSGPIFLRDRAAIGRQKGRYHECRRGAPKRRRNQLQQGTNSHSECRAIGRARVRML